MWYDFKDAWHDAVPLFHLMSKAWHVLQPRGNFISRSAWFDTLAAGAIPIVFQSNYLDFLPFGDFINYTRLMITLPQVTGPSWPPCGCLFSLLIHPPHTVDASAHTRSQLLHRPRQRRSSFWLHGLDVRISGRPALLRGLSTQGCPLH